MSTLSDIKKHFEIEFCEQVRIVSHSVAKCPAIIQTVDNRIYLVALIANSSSDSFIDVGFVLSDEFSMSKCEMVEVTCIHSESQNKPTRRRRVEIYADGHVLEHQFLHLDSIEIFTDWQSTPFTD